MAKKDIHITYIETKVKCACGNEFDVKSDKPEINLETCNECHPAYTGQKRTTGATGRVERFNKKFGIKE